MADVVFILGAGASADGGAPVMRDFLDAARKLRLSGNIRDSRISSAFDEVFAAIGKLQVVHSKARDFDINNIESVFSAFEMAQLLGHMPGYDVAQIDSLITALKTVIATTLEATLRFDRKKSSGTTAAPRPYPQFVDLLHKCRAMSPSYNPVVITFNYDLALDYALQQGGLPARYFLDDTDPRVGIPLLKLHGSLNWIANGDDIVPWHMEGILSNGPGNLFFHTGTDEVRHFQITPHLINGLRGQPPIEQPSPVIIPPTWNKYGYQKQITRVWSQASKELGSAQHIFVIGYSLPLSDLFFRYLYALGSVGDQPLSTFHVFNPDEKVCARFQDMMGPGSEARFRFYGQKQHPFEYALGQIAITLENWR